MTTAAGVCRPRTCARGIPTACGAAARAARDLYLHNDSETRALTWHKMS
ncbi:MAG: hypothetical protein IPF40_01095 [Actinomycetales bacterium]|uniref:Uncharacterized protein n=1 Tax=Candidatus Phosphoribacter hodrii TaxID=2953743 RepID=A0A934X3J4_9MICO|nr:hypothetical protein [Candidatus Phosphoribacter hodrii]